MDFEVYQEDTPEQARFRKEVRTWLESNVSSSRSAETEASRTAERAQELEQQRREFRRRLGAPGPPAAPSATGWGRDYGSVSVT